MNKVKKGKTTPNIMDGGWISMAGDKLKSTENKPVGHSVKRMLQLSDTVSDILQKVVIALLIALVLSQIALQSSTVRGWITGTDQLEGRPFQ